MNALEGATTGTARVDHPVSLMLSEQAYSDPHNGKLPEGIEHRAPLNAYWTSMVR